MFLYSVACTAYLTYHFRPQDDEDDGTPVVLSNWRDEELEEEERHAKRHKYLEVEEVKLSIVPLGTPDFEEVKLPVVPFWTPERIAAIRRADNLKLRAEAEENVRNLNASRRSVQAIIAAAVEKAAAEEAAAAEAAVVAAKEAEAAASLAEAKAKEKRLVKLVGAVVVNCMSKYSKSMDHDEFKKHAKEVDCTS